jgi:SAM-dependent methyltransferase
MNSSMKLKESWKNRSDAEVRGFLRDDHEGHRHPSRLKAITLLEGLHSVLDVGCGTGIMFELLQGIRPRIDYVGVDVTERFIEPLMRCCVATCSSTSLITLQLSRTCTLELTAN